MQSRKKDPVLNLVAGGIAGFTESLCCHPLDTIKTRVQLANNVAKARERSSHGRSGAMLVATKLVRNEGFFALYSGLSAVMAGIVPKMAVRFSSFDIFKGWLGDREGRNKGFVFLAGLGSGVTEAVLVVTPAEVCKIRMQTQERSIRLADGSRTSSSTLKYRGVLQTAAVIVREEGLGALYKGLAPTILRQGCNQAVNFTFYQLFKTQLSAYLGKDELLPWQHMLLGGLSGGFGPCINNPLDVVKTRLQKQKNVNTGNGEAS